MNSKTKLNKKHWKMWKKSADSGDTRRLKINFVMIVKKSTILLLRNSNIFVSRYSIVYYRNNKINNNLSLLFLQQYLHRLQV